MIEYYKPEREIAHGCKLPANLDLAVWHYMDFGKFLALLQKRAIYLCRGDHLQDRFEGTYSNRQIKSMNDLFKKINEPEMIELENERRAEDRKKAFISCWCLSDVDLDLMWKAYTNGPLDVAIKSTIRKLQSVCDDAIKHWPLDICKVNYFDHAKGEKINYWGAPTVFMHKDNHFELDNEIRIMHWPNYSTPPDHVYLPADLEVLIDSIVTKPGTTKSQFEAIISLLQCYDLKNISVIYSRDDRTLIE